MYFEYHCCRKHADEYGPEFNELIEEIEGFYEITREAILHLYDQAHQVIADSKYHVNWLSYPKNGKS